MKKDKRPQMTAAMERSWRPGGPSRIAYDKRMKEKKTSSVVDQTGEFKRMLDHRTSQPAAEVIGHPRAEMACAYYRAACLLLLLNEPDVLKPAERLIGEADAILGAGDHRQ